MNLVFVRNSFAFSRAASFLPRPSSTRSYSASREGQQPSPTTTPPDEAVLDDVPEDARRHCKVYRLTGTGRRNAAEVVSTKGTGHALFTDVPKDMGGGDIAPQPVEHLLAALIGCAQATAFFVGRSMTPTRLLIDRVEFDVAAYRDQRGALSLPIDATPDVPARLLAVKGTATVFLRTTTTNNNNNNSNKKTSATATTTTTTTMTSEQLALLAEQTEARCPVANMLTASGCVLDVRWRDGSKVAVDADDE